MKLPVAPSCFAPAWAAWAVLSVVGLTPHAVQAQTPAPAPVLQVVQAVRAEISTPINAAQTLLGEGKLDEAMRNVQLAAAAPALTPYETMLVERTRAAIAQRQGNTALVMQALEAALGTDEVPTAEAISLIEAMVGAASRAADHARVLRWSQRYIELGGGNDAVRMVRIQSQIASGDEKGAMQALAQRAVAGDASGQVQPEAHLRTLLSLQRKLQDPGVTRTLERLAAAYPRPEYWMDLVVEAARDPAIPDRTLIQMYRLLRHVGGVRQFELSEEMAEMSQKLGHPGEALAVLDEGFAAGHLGKGGRAAAHQALREQMRKQAGAERADRPAAEVSAKAAVDGNGLVDLGWAAVAALPQGSPAAEALPGLALIEQGMAKGGLRRPVEAGLQLAMAQVLAGRKDAAFKTLQSLSEPAKADALAVPVHLWRLFAQAPAMLPTRQ